MLQQAENPQFRLVPHRYGSKMVAEVFRTSIRPDSGSPIQTQTRWQPDGGVHQLWTVRGSTNDPTIPNCALTQPDSAAEEKAGNLAFRIPLQMMGLGLIESIEDREILAQHDASAALRAPLGITGHPNRSGNDGTITRFGWKAQNKSITIFAGEAYNVEMGDDQRLSPPRPEKTRTAKVQTYYHGENGHGFEPVHESYYTLWGPDHVLRRRGNLSLARELGISQKKQMTVLLGTLEIL